MDVMCVSGMKRGMNQTAGKGGGEGCMYNKNVKQQGEEKGFDELNNNSSRSQEAYNAQLD
jgi:hypothetical protein